MVTCCNVKRSQTSIYIYRWIKVIERTGGLLIRGICSQAYCSLARAFLASSGKGASFLSQSLNAGVSDN